MLFLKYLLIAACFGIFACVAGMVLYDIFLAYELDRLLKRREKQAETLLAGDVPAPDAVPPARATVATLRPRRRIRWSEAAKLSVIAAIVGLLGTSILVLPDGQAGVRISQLSVRPPWGALRPDAPDRAVGGPACSCSTCATAADGIPGRFGLERPAGNRTARE